MLKVSVIVPVYNAEKYLETCIQSLLSQTLKEVEYIFVDDGSTDSSLQILSNYKKKDDRIKIIHQENQYAGVARNNGMSIATGKYLMFLDSDDFIKNNTLTELYSIAEKNQIDILVFGNHYYDEKSQKIIGRKLPNAPLNKVLSPNDLKNHLFNFCDGVPWNKFLLRTFILKSKVKYQNIKICNDEYFNKMIMPLANRIYCMGKCFVYYRKNNPNSLQSVRYNSSQDYNCILLAFIKLRHDLCGRHLFYGDVRASYYSIIDSQIRTCIRFVRDEQVFDNLYRFLKEHMVPDLYEDKTLIPINSTAGRIYYSETVKQFLVEELRNSLQKNSESVSRKSKEYMVGKTVMYVPRLLRKYILKKY